MSPDQHLSTTTCGNLTGFSPATIAKAIDRGDLKGFRVPGSKHRRVQAKALIEWLVRHGVPVPDKLTK
jgi:hypothetical protein